MREVTHDRVHWNRQQQVQQDARQGQQAKGIAAEGMDTPGQAQNDQGKHMPCRIVPKKVTLNMASRGACQTRIRRTFASATTAHTRSQRPAS
ncbi:MAG: hypothetical protein MZV70_21240 [Desulfobacterales bacterium]|nr:hypothetical protein [Desulfobacterales bacterium]